MARELTVDRALWVLLKLAIRYVTGQHLDGKRRSDATFLKDGTDAEASHWSRNPWWPLLAGWKRAAVRLLPPGMAWCLLFYRGATERATAVITGLGAGCGLILAYLWWEERDHRHKVGQFAKAIAAPAGHPAIEARKAVHVPADYRTREDAEVIIDVPHDFTGADRDMEDITRAVTAKLGLLNPCVTPALNSRNPRLIYTRSQPPPLSVTFRDIRNDIYGAKPSEVIFGLGPPVGGKRQISSVDLDSDTPMVAASMTTGDGKSALARNFAAQLAYHGALIICLDYKWFSHMWLDGLPMACYARTPEQIHQVLCWLGHDERDGDGSVIRDSELTRRKKAGLASSDQDGNVHGHLGHRILVLSEEGNSTVKVLKRYWRSIGGKGTSPALEALDEVGATGRQLLVNVLYIAQRLSAKASGADGSADARENIGTIITKDPTEATWKMLAAGHAQPPSSGHKGRYQLISRKEVSEFQGAWWTPAEAREFATAGTIAIPPPDMPFISRRDLVPGAVGQDAFALQGASEQAFVVGQDAPVLPAGAGPAAAVTLAEAVVAGLFVSKAAARKMAQRRGWKPVGGDPVSGFKYAIADLARGRNDDRQ